MKGIFKIYYKQQQFLRQAHRQIKNYESNAPSINQFVPESNTSTNSTQTIEPSTSNAQLNRFSSSSTNDEVSYREKVSVIKSNKSKQNNNEGKENNRESENENYE